MFYNERITTKRSHIMRKLRKTPAGTQSIRRALEMLRVLAEHNNKGLSLKELTDTTGLGRSTAHRLISCLVDEGFAMRESLTKRYHIGLDALQVGLSAVSETSVTDSLRPLIMRLARMSGDTVFLVIRQGDYALCLAREHGDFPVRIFTISEGEKRILGVGAGGLALLASLPQETIKKIYKRHKVDLEKSGLTIPILKRKIREYKEKGFSETESTITPGISGVGYAFRPSRITHVAVSFGAIDSRMSPERRNELGELIKYECDNWLRATDGTPPSTS